MPDTELSKAITWYKSLLTLLKSKGLDLSHKGDLAKVMLLPDLSAQQQVIADYNPENGVPAGLVDFLRRDRVPAFIRPDEKGLIQLPEIKAGEADPVDPMLWIAREISTEPGIHTQNEVIEADPEASEKVRRLYAQALAGDLQLCLGGAPADEHTYAIYVNDEGAAAADELSHAQIMMDNADLNERQKTLVKRLKARQATDQKLHVIATAEKEAYGPYREALSRNYKFDVKDEKYRLEKEKQGTLEGKYRIYTGKEPKLGKMNLVDRSYLEISYDLPEGLSEAACSAITLGAILDDAFIGKIRTTSSMKGDTISMEDFIRTNFTSNVILSPDDRFDEFGYAIREGRKSAAAALGQIHEQPAQAAKYLKQAADTVCTSLEMYMTNDPSYEQMLLYTLAKEITQALEQQPLKGKVDITERERVLLSFAARQADIFGPYMEEYGKKYEDRLPEDKREIYWQAMVIPRMLSKSRTQVMEELIKTPAAEKKVVELIKEEVRERKWPERFQNCQTLTELNNAAKQARKLEEGPNPRVYEVEIGALQDKYDRQLQPELLKETPLYQWMTASSPEEIRETMVELVKNTSTYKYNFRNGNPARSDTIRSYDLSQFQGIAPYARYEVAGGLKEGMAAITAAAGQPTKDQKYTDMMKTLEDILAYINRNPKNSLTQDAASEYQRMLSHTLKVLSDYVDGTFGEENALDQILTDPDSVYFKARPAVKQVRDELLKQETVFRTNLAEYNRGKDPHFAREMSWYKAFIQDLKQKSIDINNGVSLAAVKLYADDGSAIPAFLSDGKGKGVMGLPEKVRKLEPMAYLLKNVQVINPDLYPNTGEGLTQEEQQRIRRLYDAARKGNLVIDESTDPVITVPAVEGKMTQEHEDFYAMMNALTANYRKNPASFTRSSRDKPSKGEELCGATWDSYDRTHERQKNVLSADPEIKRAELENVQKAVKAVLDADRFVWNGSDQYGALMTAAGELEELSKKYAAGNVNEDEDSLGIYKLKLDAVKAAAEAYTAYRADPQDDKGKHRVEAARAIAAFAGTKAMGIEQLTFAQIPLHRNEIQQIRVEDHAAVPFEMTAIVRDITDRLKALGTKEERGNIVGCGIVERFNEELQKLQQLKIKTFGVNGEKAPSAQELYEYGLECQKTLTNLSDVKGVLTNTEVKSYSLRELCRYITTTYGDFLALELKPYRRTRKPGEKIDSRLEKMAEIVIKESKEAIEIKNRERVTGRGGVDNARSSSLTEGIGRELFFSDYQLTGDIDELVTFYLNNQEGLDPEAEAYLKGRIGALAFFNDLELKGKNNKAEPVFTVQQSGENILLDGYQGKYQYQTTGNGCWSVSYAMLLESRGISLNQELVRAYRPDLGRNDVEDISEDQVRGMLQDQPFSPLELGDLTLKVLPAGALRQVALQQYTKDQYTDVKAYLKQTIRDTLINHRSPISLTDGRHFLTIVGIKGDELQVLNSLGQRRGLLETLTLDQLVKKNSPISLTWVQDLTFDKKGSCTNLPEAHKDLHYVDGKLTGIGLDNDPLNRAGSSFKTSVKSGKVVFDDTIYLPDQVPATFFGIGAVEQKAENEPVEAAPKHPVENEPVEETPQNPEKDQAKAAPENPAEKEPAKAGPEKAEVDQLIREKIKEAHEKVINVVNRQAYYRNPGEELRYTLATLLACKIIQDSFNNHPEETQKYKDLIDGSDVIHNLTATEEFKSFRRSLSGKVLKDLCECKSKDWETAEDRFYEGFKNHTIQLQKGKSSPEKDIISRTVKEYKPPVG